MKNLKTVVVNGILVALGVVFFGFMAGTYLLGSGYELLQILLEELSSYQAILYTIPTLIVLVLVGLMTVFAVLNILIALGVIKNEKLGNTFAKCQVIFSIIAFVCYVLAFIGLLTISTEIGYALIINLIVVLAALVVSVYAKKSRKTTETAQN